MPLGSPKAQDISSAVVDSLATLAQMKSYRDFPERLHHRVPHWVEPGGLFHIRIRLDREKTAKDVNRSVACARAFGFSNVVRSEHAMAYHTFPVDD